MKRDWDGKNAKKVMRMVAALAFFSCQAALPPAMANTNWVNGTAYGTNHIALATAESIASVADGPGSLDVGYAGTTNLLLGHDIEGSIVVSNGFGGFSINADGATVEGSGYAVLTVLNGTNLVIAGGQFNGTGREDGTVGPPIPGQPSQTNTVSSAAMGGVIYNTENVLVSKTGFAGATYAPDNATSRGTDGLRAIGTTLTFKDDGANSSIIAGGNGGAVNQQNAAIQSSGGTGLYLNDASLTISNGTFKGGSGGTATAGSTFSATTTGGHALHATNSTLAIHNGTFAGGSSGTASTSGTGSVSAKGGAAVYAADSVVDITGGTFTGGAAGTAATASGGAALLAENATVSISGTPVFKGGKNTSAVLLRNTDFTASGGTFTGGSYGTGNYFGLVSIVHAGQSNNIVLNGGTFNSIDFAGSGSQFLTAGAALVVDEYVVVDGGTVVVDHLADLPFQTVVVRDGAIRFNNDFTLASEGIFSLDSASSHAGFSNLAIASNATFYAGQGTIEASGNFGLYSGGTLVFSIVSTNHGSIAADTATFQTTATIQIDATAASFGFGTNDLLLVSASNGISVIDSGGATNLATGATLAQNVQIQTFTSDRTELSEVLVDGSSNLVIRFATLTLRDYWNASGQFGNLIDELDQINDPEMSAIIAMIGDRALSGSAVEQTYFTTFNTFQTSLQGMRAAVGQSLSRASEFREQLKLIPAGAKGPERHNQLRGWGKYYGQYYSLDEQDLNVAYDTVLHGGVLGIDTSFGNLLVGLSGGASRYRTTTDTDAQEDVTAAHGNLYGTYGMDRGYIDAGIAYGHNRVETRTADPFRLDGDFDARLASVYLGGGYDLIDTKGGSVFTPEASIQYSQYRQDAYTEEGTAAVPRVIDEFDADSILGSLGMNVSMLNATALKTFGFKVDGRFHWMHEFIPDPSDATFMLEGGSNQYRLAYPSLDEDIFRIGIGFSFFNTMKNKPKNVMFRVDFDELFGQDFNSHNLSTKLVYAF